MLRQLDDDLWSSDSSVRIPGGARLPARMTVVRRREGSGSEARLWLHSPVALDEATVEALAALGEVGDIVAPNCFHHFHLGPVLERFPTARLHAPPGLRSKRPDLRVDAELRPGVDTWADFEVVEIAGAPELHEFVFLHQPSASLILTDLVFNIHEAPGLLTPLVLRMVGAWRRLNQSKLWRRFTKDRRAAAAAVERMLALEFRRIVPAHGEVLEGEDLRERLAEALAWMRAGGD